MTFFRTEGVVLGYSYSFGNLVLGSLLHVMTLLSLDPPTRLFDIGVISVQFHQAKVIAECFFRGGCFGINPSGTTDSDSHKTKSNIK